MKPVRTSETIAPVSRRTFLRAAGVAAAAAAITAAQPGAAWAAPAAAQAAGPRLPLVLDGVRQTGDALRAAGGRPLCYVISQQTQAEGLAYAFTTAESKRAFVASRRDLFGPAAPIAALGAYSYFYEGSTYNGDKYEVRQATALNTFTHLSRGSWPGSMWKNWNDQMSSVTTANHIVALYEHIYYEGSYVEIMPYTSVRLAYYGFDNRASSAVVQNPLY